METKILWLNLEILLFVCLFLCSQETEEWKKKEGKTLCVEMGWEQQRS